MAKYGDYMGKKYATDYITANFQMLKELRRTEKNTVSLALNKLDNTPYIIKTTRAQGAPYRQLKTLSLPILPKILFIVENDESTTTVEEYLNGQNLRELFAATGPLSENSCLDILRQLCIGLSALHQQRIIHRDINPGNIILTNDKIVKLIDFETMRITKDDRQHDTQYLGTKGYAPPEQYGFGQTDVRTDIYAIGMTFKELLGADYHGKLLPILNKCTQLDPKARYQTTSELLAAVNTATSRFKTMLVPVLILTVLAVGFIIYRNYTHRTVSTPPLSKQQTDTPTVVQPVAPLPETAKKAFQTPPIDSNATPPSVQTLPHADSFADAPTIMKNGIAFRFYYSGSGTYSTQKASAQIVFDSCRSWDKLSLVNNIGRQKYPFLYFPAEEYVTIKITNTNSSPLDHPYLTVSGDFVTKAEFFEDLDGTFKDTHTAHAYTGFYDSIAWQKNPSLAPDTTQTFEIPLRKFIIEDVYKANVGLIFHFGFESATSERIDHMVWLKFRDFPNSNPPF